MKKGRRIARRPFCLRAIDGAQEVLRVRRAWVSDFPQYLYRDFKKSYCKTLRFTSKTLSSRLVYSYVSIINSSVYIGHLRVFSEFRQIYDC